MLKRKFALTIMALVLLPAHVSLAQVPATSRLTDQEASASTSNRDNWLTGIWKVTSAKVIEDHESRDPIGHHDLMLFSDGMEVEIYLPNASKHRPMSAVGARISRSARDKEDMLQLLTYEHNSDGKSKNGRCTVAATNPESTTAKVTFLHGRDDGKAWKYQLIISKITDAEQLKTLATSMVPFLTNTADINMFGQRGLRDGMQQTEEVYCDLLKTWANLVLHGNSGGKANLHNRSTSGNP